MSLPAIANHMATYGRNGDSMLVHMTPSEVKGLQALAEKHGTSLTINPDTGLPEAFSLKSLVPIAAGAMLGPAGFGIASSAMGAAAMVGGVTALASGNLKEGLMAGLGAYGGYGLGAGLAGMGAESSAVANESAAETARLAGAENVAAEKVASENAKAALADSTFNPDVKMLDPSVAAAQPAPSPIMADKIALPQTVTQAPTFSQNFGNASAGFDRLTSPGGLDALNKQMAANAASTMGGPASAMGGAGYSLAGALGMDAMSQKNPAAGAKASPGYIRPYNYDPYGQRYTAQTPVKADEWGSRSFNAADGGIVALAHGGAVQHYDAGGLTADQQAAAQAWVAANPNATREEALSVAAASGYTPEQANLAWSQYGPAAAAPAAQAQAAPSSINDLYQQVLGRAPDTGGAEYWSKQFGDTLDANEIATFRSVAQAELANRSPAEQAALAPNLVGAAPTYNAASTQQIRDYINSNHLDPAGIEAATKYFNVDPNAVTAAMNAQNTVATVYRNVLGRDPDPAGMAYWTDLITSGKSTPEEMYNNFLKGARENSEIMNKGLSLTQAQTPFKGYQSAEQLGIADEWVRNVLGREITDADRQQQWYKDATSAKVANSVEAGQRIYDNFLKYALDVGATTTKDKTALARQIIAEKGLTDADVYAQTGKTITELVGRPKTDLDIFQASQLLAPSGSEFDFRSLKGKTQPTVVATTPQTYAPAGTTNPYGNATNPGDITRNADDSTTITPNIPGRPYGGFTGMDQVRNAYTQGGGSLGYTSPVVTSAAQHKAMYDKQTGGSRAAFDYLMGSGAYPTVPSTPTGEIMKPYSESVLGVSADNTRFAQRFNPVTRKYEANPDYKAFNFNQDTGQSTRGMNATELRDFVSDPKNLSVPSASTGFLGDLVKKATEGLLDRPVWMAQNNISYEQLAAALGISVAEAKKRYPVTKASEISTRSTATGSGDGGGGDSGDGASAGPGDGAGNSAGGADGSGVGAGAGVGDGDGTAKRGGLLSLANGGMSGYNLGGYSDGGRLLRGPGDGVSDSIPASIGNKQPARLADGEFVVPARIVSELGNGSTDAGARKLYQMMDRVQKARGKTTGKGKVATNSRADKYLPV